MGDDKLGTMILSSDNLNSSVVMPQIPIRPNSSIPKVIGGIILIGGLIIFGLGFSLVAGQYLEVDYEQQAAAYEIVGLEITAEEIELLDSKYKEANYYLITGILQIIPGLILIIGGIQLLLCKKVGVYTSIIGGIMLFLLNLVSNFWGSSIDSDIGVSLESQVDIIETAICSICNLFCISLPLIPMFAPAGRAALTPYEIKKRPNLIEEE